MGSDVVLGSVSGAIPQEGRELLYLFAATRTKLMRTPLDIHDLGFMFGDPDRLKAALIMFSGQA